MGMECKGRSEPLTRVYRLDRPMCIYDMPVVIDYEALSVKLDKR